MRQHRVVTDPGVERKRWEQCRLCALGARAFKHVWGEGSLPCDVLIIGEAPGNSEDALGEPFVGPAGRLLREALPPLRVCSTFITNLLACLPCDVKSVKARIPTTAELKACSPRVQWICSHSRAQRVVLVGSTAALYYTQVVLWTPQAEVVQVTHPAFALRQGLTACKNWVTEARRLFNVHSRTYT